MAFGCSAIICPRRHCHPIIRDRAATDSIRREDGRALCEPWPLSTFPAPDAMPPRLRLMIAPFDGIDIVDAAPIPVGVNFGATRHRQMIEQGRQGEFRTVHSQ